MDEPASASSTAGIVHNRHTHHIEEFLSSVTPPSLLKNGVIPGDELDLCPRFLMDILIYALSPPFYLRRVLLADTEGRKDPV